MGGLGFSEELSLFGILGSFLKWWESKLYYPTDYILKKITLKWKKDQFYLVSISNLPNRSLLAFGLISRPNRPPKRVNEATPDMVSMLIPSSPKSGINDSGCREAIEDGSISPVPLDLTGTKKNRSTITVSSW